MLPSATKPPLHRKRLVLSHRKRFFSMLGGALLCTLLCLEFVTIQPTSVAAYTRTGLAARYLCSQVSFSNDGNPFPLCPGPIGGNCVWWAWEQWHLLGYNLPLNWGNAADWFFDAQRAGLSTGWTPRVGAIAVFPRADGIWAYGSPGHVAFVTAVHNDGMTFDVTYQNYGDPTPMYIGRDYNIFLINQARFQNGGLRFIYFPRLIDPQRFMQLPGVGPDSFIDVAQANGLYSPFAKQASRPVAELSALSSDQEFNADFRGTGRSDLLLYDRKHGSLKVLDLASVQSPTATNQKQSETTPRLVTLGDATTRAGKWGSALAIYVGDFAGSGKASILLYDRTNGRMQLLSLNDKLKIQRHVLLDGWGSGWELSVGRFDGKRSGVLMYNRFAGAPLPTLPPPVTVVSTPRPVPSAVRPAQTHPARRTTPPARPHPTPSPTATSTPDIMPTATPTMRPEVTPNASATPSPATVPTEATATPSQARSKMQHMSNMLRIPLVAVQMQGRSARSDDPSPIVPGGDLSGGGWGQSAVSNVQMLDFNPDLSLRQRQHYTLSQTTWEVYIGRYVNHNQDGLFLYDRSAGEGRLLAFNGDMQVKQYHEMHQLSGDWLVSSGDFIGAGRAQLLLYNPGSGDARLLVLARDLSLAGEKSYSGWGKNVIPYTGYFGSAQLSVMLYDPRTARSTFLAFDASLQIKQRYQTKSWQKNRQILVGSFFVHEDCTARTRCLKGDDMLILDRRSGQIEQYAFTFGRKFKVFDNRVQAFVRSGLTSREQRLAAIDSTHFGLISTLHSGIRGEEIY